MNVGVEFCCFQYFKSSLVKIYTDSANSDALGSSSMLPATIVQKLFVALTISFGRKQTNLDF